MEVGTSLRSSPPLSPSGVFRVREEDIGPSLGTPSIRERDGEGKKTDESSEGEKRMACRISAMTWVGISSNVVNGAEEEEEEHTVVMQQLDAEDSGGKTMPLIQPSSSVRVYEHEKETAAVATAEDEDTEEPPASGMEEQGACFASCGCSLGIIAFTGIFSLGGCPSTSAGSFTSTEEEEAAAKACIFFFEQM